MAFYHYKTNKNVVLTVSKILLNNRKDEKFKDVNVTSEGTYIVENGYHKSGWPWEKNQPILKISTDLGSLYIKTTQKKRPGRFEGFLNF